MGGAVPPPGRISPGEGVAAISSHCRRPTRAALSPLMAVALLAVGCAESRAPRWIEPASQAAFELKSSASPRARSISLDFKPNGAPVARQPRANAERSPDGRMVAFTVLGERSGREEIWVASVDGRGESRFLTYGSSPSWSPASDCLAFERPGLEQGRTSIWLIHVQPGAESPVELAAGSSGACWGPGWSADGEWVVYRFTAEGGAFGSEATRRVRPGAGPRAIAAAIQPGVGYAAGREHSRGVGPAASPTITSLGTASEASRFIGPSPLALPADWPARAESSNKSADQGALPE